MNMLHRFVLMSASTVLVLGFLACGSDPLISQPVPEPTARQTAAWEQSGDWSRNEYAEQGFAEYLRQQGVAAESIRMASLDSPVISPDRDVFITLGCIDGLGVIHILSYTDQLPAGETEYAFGLFSAGRAGPENVFSHTDLANVGDIAGDYRIIITEPERISSVLEMLRAAAGASGQFVGLDVQRRGRTLRATFEPTGIEDALQYVGCFG